MRLFYNYSIDCELPPEGPFGGPATWEVAEQSVRGFVQVITDLGMRDGATLFVYPDVAMTQRALFREMADAGIETALHLNGLRYSRLTGHRAKWMGAMNADEQREAIRMAKADLEDVIGRPVTGYRACYGSANNDTFPLCEELGFAWTSTSPPDSHNSTTHAMWSGAWRYPHHTSRVNRLICGNMALYEMPLTNGVRIRHQGDSLRPLDMRAETPPEIAGENHEVFRRIIEENLDEMDRRDQPVRGIIVGSHNTNLFADPTTHQHANLMAVCSLAKELATARGYAFTPAPFTAIKEEAERTGAF